MLNAPRSIARHVIHVFRVAHTIKVVLSGGQREIMHIGQLNKPSTMSIGVNSTLQELVPTGEMDEAMDVQETLLRAILATVARQTFSPTQILEVMGQKAGEKQYRAFNLCDGTRTQAEIAKELGLDSANFSKTINRWIDGGIVIRVGEQHQVRPLHVYPLPETSIQQAVKK